MKEKILNRHKAFSDLAKEENLKRINIDERLKPYFVNVLNKFQSYFEEKGLIYATNYALFFERNLFGDGCEKFSFEIAKLKEKYGESVGGLYENKDKKVFVDEDFFNETAGQYALDLEAVLAHEFIHFLAMTELPWLETKEGDFIQLKEYYQEHFAINGGFFTEGFTQLLTEQIYPHYVTYYPYTSMVKTYLKGFGGLNFFEFLRGRLPGKEHYDSKITNFMTYGEKLFLYRYTSRITWENEITHPYYQESFNLLVDAFKEQVKIEIERFEFATVEDFAYRLFEFKDSVVFESTYLNSAMDFLITEFVSANCSNADLMAQFDAKEVLREIVQDHMKTLVTPNLEGEYYIDTEDGFRIGIEMMKEDFSVQIFSPSGVLIRSAHLPKKDVSAAINISESIINEPKVLEIFREDDSIGLSFYDQKMTELTEEEVSKLPQEALPIVYNIPLESQEAKEEIMNCKIETFDVFRRLNELVDKKKEPIKKIVKQDHRTVEVYRVDGIYEPESGKEIFISADMDSNFKVYYSENGKAKQLRVVKDMVSIPFGSSYMNVKVKVSQESLYIETDDEKDDPISFKCVYRSSKEYFERIKDKEEYKTYTMQEL